jgi:stage II sporulation protein AA (anti-sigma F factor antagonist)
MAAATNLSPGSALGIKTVVRPGRHTLVLGGELDISSALDLQYFVVCECAEGARKIVLDMSDLQFLDSSGVEAILASWSVCRDHGVGFALTPARGAVKRALEIMGMLDVLPFARVAV